MEKIQKHWYLIKDVEKIDTPALIIYKDRVLHNIDIALKMVNGNPLRFRPHVKTHKSIDVCKLLIGKGITKFKCATISEAEMLAMAGAKDVLLAYQPNGPKLSRFMQLIKGFTTTEFSCLIDNMENAKDISKIAMFNNIIIKVFIDINVGMNRTGIQPGKAAEDLIYFCSKLPGIYLSGLHVYDGHLRMKELNDRTVECNKAFNQVELLLQNLKDNGYKDLKIIAGGSTTFSIHSQRSNVECSPGTFIYWDAGYNDKLTEMNFLPAALVLTRVISKPLDDKITIDLGHKSVASENLLSERVSFLNASPIEFLSHSEEHMVLRSTDNYKIGDVLYGLPDHICPTCALYESAYIVEDNNITDEWMITARNRKITI